jgi:hypothetical protein
MSDIFVLSLISSFRSEIIIGEICAPGIKYDEVGFMMQAPLSASHVNYIDNTRLTLYSADALFNMAKYDLTALLNP